MQKLEETASQADFVRWGYCLVQDAMSQDQCAAFIERLEDQAQAELSLRSTPGATFLLPVSGEGVDPAGRPWGFNALVNNALCKGQVFRDLVEFSEAAAQKGPLVD